MRKKTIIWLVLILLFSSMGCPDPNDDRIAWQVDIVNNLSYPIYAFVIFNPHSKKEFGPIEPEKEANVYGGLIEKTVPEQAHRTFHKLSVFSKDGVPLMVLWGAEMDEYIIFVGGRFGSDYGRLFRLEVKEENIGIGLSKRIDY